MAVDCLPCATGYHQECWKPAADWNCCCGNQNEPVLIESTKKERGGQLKEMGDVRDTESTGRKRAAIMYPLDRDAACEWSGLRNAGGGVIPIVGCRDGKQAAIHHGPDKNTLANFVGNVHRICAQCHNRWHTLNDPLYPKERPAGNVPFIPASGEYKKHDGVTPATPEDFAQDVVMWATRKLKKVKENGNAATETD